jgi:hypothetical protein
VVRPGGRPPGRLIDFRIRKDRAVVYLLALAIFVALSAACWYGSVAVYRGTVGGPDPAASPDYHTTSAAAVGVTALTSFVPFPLGYVAGLVVWAVAAFGGVGLPAGRAAVLFLYLAAGSFLARLVVLGVMDMFGG